VLQVNAQWSLRDPSAGHWASPLNTDGFFCAEYRKTLSSQPDNKEAKAGLDRLGKEA